MAGVGRPDLGSVLALAAAATVAASVPVPGAGAQETSRRVEPGQAPEDGWLGVGLISFTECLEGPGAPSEECRHTLVVGRLVHGGPAERAGLQPGDTLLALDGDRLTEGAGDGAFRRVVTGDTVSILVGRAGGRVRIRAVPRTRPDSLAIVQYHRDGAYVEDRARYLLAIPRPPVLDSLVATAVRDPNLSVETRVSVIPADRVKKIPLRSGPREVSTARERVAEMQARARELRREAVEEARELRQEMSAASRAERAEARRAAAKKWKQWVADELQPRLQVIYDSVLADARGRMDSLQSLYPAAAVAARAAARAADTLSVPAPPSPPRRALPNLPPEPEAWGMPVDRIAGAEVQPLNPGLADFFGGVERGLVVLQVLRGTPADRLGLRPGDVIVEAAGHRVTAVEGLRHALMEHGRGAEIRWVRRGRAMADTLRH